MAKAKPKRGVVKDRPAIGLGDAQDYPMVAVDQIHPHPSNARQGDTGAICESIKANGFYRPIVVQRSTGNILAGNHAHRAAVMLGMERVPVAWVECDDQRALQILLVDNRTNDLASYDNAALAELLQSLPSLEGTGFDTDALAELLQDLEIPQGKEYTETCEKEVKFLECPACGHKFPA